MINKRKIYKLRQIETPRLIIRPVQLGDELPLNKAILNSLEILQKWQPWANDSSIEATRDFVQQSVFAWLSGFVEAFPMVFIHKKDEKIIGAAGYNDRTDFNKDFYEIGYWCDIDYQGKGYVTECTNALTRYAFEVLKAKKVAILMQTENEKSKAVADRLGFYNEGAIDRDPEDCVSDLPEKNYVFSSTSIQNLPELKVLWLHKEEQEIESKLIKWVLTYFNIQDKYYISGKVIVKTPWSSVIALNIGTEVLYLKHTPKLIALEPEIIKILYQQFHACVPTVIGHNVELNCFLMKDAGVSLRSILKKSFNENLLSKAILQFTDLQIQISHDIFSLIDIGVPDWRTDKLPTLFEAAIAQKDFLLEDGLLDSEIEALKKLFPKIRELCKKLSSFLIKDTLVQPDFNDNNTLIDEKTGVISLIDLGEIAISHPFFSLINCLHVIKKHHGLTEVDEQYLQIKEACLQNFTCIESRDNIVNIFKIANALWFVYGLLAHHRLIQACHKETLTALQQGRLSEMLRELIAQKINLIEFK